MDLALLLLRLTVGGLLVGHGTQKLFGWFGGPGLDAAEAMFARFGYHPPRQAAWAAGATEAIGGGLLLLGLFTPIAAAMIVGAMVNAIAVHWAKGVWATGGGYELPLLYAVAPLVIVATGPGVLSGDAIWGFAVWGGVPMLLAALVGVISGAVVRSRRGVPAHVTSSS